MDRKLMSLLTTDPAKLAEEMRKQGLANRHPSPGWPAVRDLSVVEVMRNRKDYERS